MSRSYSKASLKCDKSRCVIQSTAEHSWVKLTAELWVTEVSRLVRYLTAVLYLNEMFFLFPSLFVRIRAEVSLELGQSSLSGMFFLLQQIFSNYHPCVKTNNGGNITWWMNEKREAMQSYQHREEGVVPAVRSGEETRRRIPQSRLTRPMDTGRPRYQTRLPGNTEEVTGSETEKTFTHSEITPL